MTTDAPVPSGRSAPLLRVVRGDPTPEEAAALVAVLTARARAARAGDGGPAGPPPSGWRDRSRLPGRSPAPGPGAWRAAYGPR
ncbi:acyl-CoA carboxylase epsilon subunit [Streptomonospora wellingtoniae]|uniref:Acyl-CoA carboxylase epsilon subunit n=1 Tax=Streptomonospora wellingtoniae TaxID=3075544 RepID=A0ABU2KZ87_9ACTN|nr:acyl-CoA carboxylase epsilon subunit [Streptomonospora sp. DSM 45055]MDT0304590.1 acyl-CoA carboxylase epsilon subunit [Streptomonospora sp. DSM 45055]